MEGVFFDPWVGQDYFEGINGKRIMVLGHDHVCGGCDKCGDVANREECAEFTQIVVKDYIGWRKTGIVPRNSYAKWLQTYLNFAKSFFGYEPEVEEEISKLWNKVLFYEYVQVAVANYDEDHPAEAYESAQTSFIEVINKYEPDCIIVWGKPVYDSTPLYAGRNLEPFHFEDKKAEQYEYILSSGKKCMMIKIHHPSMYFSPMK